MNREEIEEVYKSLNIGLSELSSYHPDSASTQIVISAIFKLIVKSKDHIDAQEQTIKELRGLLNLSEDLDVYVEENKRLRIDNQYQKDTMKVYYDKLQTLREEIESLKCCGNCKPLDIFDCEGCKYCDNGDSDNWIKR